MLSAVKLAPIEHQPLSVACPAAHFCCSAFRIILPPPFADFTSEQRFQLSAWPLLNPRLPL